jgi:hypothetical protein
MKPSKPFVISLAFVTAIGVSVLLGAPRVRAAEARDSMPLTTSRSTLPSNAPRLHRS